MAHLSGTERAKYVQGMFARIAARYDLMNRLMTLGRDHHWRREVIRLAKLPSSGGSLLDLGAGTGDLGLAAYRRNPDTTLVEADFTFEMMRVGKERSGASVLHWSAADALTLPFPDETFEAVVSGFLLRNVIDLTGCLVEQYRVLKPGGRMVVLDTTRPLKNWTSPVVRFYMHTIIPVLGRLISGEGDAYIYLPDTSEGFLSAEALVGSMAAAGFNRIGFKRLNFGTIAIHWGSK